MLYLKRATMTRLTKQSELKTRYHFMAIFSVSESATIKLIFKSNSLILSRFYVVAIICTIYVVTSRKKGTKRCWFVSWLNSGEGSSHSLCRLATDTIMPLADVCCRCEYKLFSGLSMCVRNQSQSSQEAGVYFCLSGDFPVEPGTTFQSATRRWGWNKNCPKKVGFFRDSTVTSIKIALWLQIWRWYYLCASFFLSTIWEKVQYIRSEESYIWGSEGEKVVCIWARRRILVFLLLVC